MDALLAAIVARFYKRHRGHHHGQLLTANYREHGTLRRFQFASDITHRHRLTDTRAKTAGGHNPYLITRLIYQRRPFTYRRAAFRCIPLTAPAISCRVGILTHQELSVAAHALRTVLLNTVQAPSLPLV